MSGYPDLQALVVEYGAWHLIPAAAWAAYDAAVADYRAMKINAIRNEQAMNMGPQKPKTGSAPKRKGA